MTAPRFVRKTRKQNRRELILEQMEARQLLAIFTVTNSGDQGGGTLRDAITNANGSPGANVIQFQLPLGQSTISPITALPIVTNSGVTFDAETLQPGYAPGKPVVVLSGALAPVNTPGLQISGGNATVKGLVINGWQGAAGTGIVLTGSPRDTIVGCFIGTDVTGKIAMPNGGDGIDISNGNDTIGGTTLATRNIISANTFEGIQLFGSSASGNVILGNYIGVGSDGSTRLGNGFTGIQSVGAVGNQIGGVVGGAGNVISNNATGISIQGSVTNTTIEGNFIGTDATGSSAQGNTFDGIDIVGGANNVIGNAGGGRNVIAANGGAGISIQGASAKNNMVRNNLIGVGANGTSPLGNATEGIILNGVFNEIIGGIDASNGNVIAYNGSLSNNDGIFVQSGTSVEILSNSIFSNKGLGIHISTGANADQVAPVLTTAMAGAGQTQVSGTLTTIPNTDYLIQYFSNPVADPSGFGQGQTFLGSATVTTDGNGIADVSTRLSVPTTVGQVITATATVVGGTQNSSPFSADVPITAAPVTNLQVSIVANPSDAALLGAFESYTVTVSNMGPDDATGVVVNNAFDTNSTIDVASLPTNSVIDPTNPLNVITTIGSLASGATVTYTIRVMPIDVGTISLTSVATNNEIDANTTPSATVTLDVNPAADLTVQLNAQPAPVAVGSLLTYILTVTNNGPSNANNVVAIDSLPANSVLNTDTITPSQGDFSITPDGLTITFNAGILPVGASASLTFQVTPNTVGSVINTATVQAMEADTNPLDNTTSITTQVANSADLGVTVRANPSPTFISGTLTYLVTVTNNGPSDATGAVLTDILPSGVTYVSATSSQGDPATESNGTITANLGAIASGASATLMIVVTPQISGSLINTATVMNTTPTEIDTNPGNNTTSLPEVLSSPVNLGISLVGNPQPVSLGSNLTYTLVVHNSGPAAATNVVVNDLLPAGVVVVSITSSNGGTPINSGGLIIQNLGTIESGQDATLTVVVTPQSSSLLTSTATLVSTDQFNTNAANNRSIAMNTVSPADVVVSISSSSANPIVGNSFSYTINVANGGPTAASNFKLTAVLPANLVVLGFSSTRGTAVVSKDPTTGTNTLTLQLSQLDPATFGIITVNVIPIVSGSTTVAAAVTSDNYDTNSANNLASSTLNIINLPGTFQFSSPTASGQETDGLINLTVTRTDGTSGTVVLNYQTINGTAIAGVNYVAANGSISFGPGETSKTIAIQVIHDNQITPNLNFQVALTGTSSGGGTIGIQSVASVTVINVDRDLVSPQVTAVAPLTNGKVIYGIVVGFSKAVDQARATDPANYSIFLSGRDGKPGSQNQFISVIAAFYNSQDNSVTLVPAVPLALGKFYGVAINGTTATAIIDLSGNVLSGNGTGIPGSDYETFFALGSNLTYVDASGSTVNLKLAKGGVMYLTRFANGQANVLQLLGVVPGRSQLSGTVHRTRSSLRYTTINQIVGLGAFGDVHSTLTTPAFYVLTPSDVTTSIAVGSKARRATVGSTTPVGPARSR